MHFLVEVSKVYAELELVENSIVASKVVIGDFVIKQAKAAEHCQVSKVTQSQLLEHQLVQLSYDIHNQNAYCHQVVVQLFLVEDFLVVDQVFNFTDLVDLSSMIAFD